MSRRFALAVMLAGAVAACACGKYGPPERTVGQKPMDPLEATYPEPAVPEEAVVPEPDFEDDEPEEENDS